MRALENPATQEHATQENDNWDRHWASYSEAAARNPGQRYRRQLICRLLSRYGASDASHIVDLGSGQGDLSRDLRKAFPKAEIAGIELSAAGVAIASAKVPDVRFFQRDLLEPAGASDPLRSWAQYAVCSEVLEHLDDPGLFLANASEYLGPGGTLIVTVPGGPMSQFDRHIGHRRHYTPATLRAILEDSGFAVELATTAGFPFFNLYRLVVILRGSSLISDVDAGSPGVISGLLARLVMALFRPLFALNVFGTRFGWQIVAVARLKTSIVTDPPIEKPHKSE
jgi:2-polyprenyl-3-methyl-5-hydroxy-6-metoxy-1,4-benzoquinol methylase